MPRSTVCRCLSDHPVEVSYGTGYRMVRYRMQLSYVRYRNNWHSLMHRHRAYHIKIWYRVLPGPCTLIQVIKGEVDEATLGNLWKLGIGILRKSTIRYCKVWKVRMVRHRMQ